jgi:hypothetical protein
MFNKSTVETCGSGLVGWRQSANSSYTQLTAALKVSNSGYYVNDLPSVNFDNIEKTISADQTDTNTYLENIHNAELHSLVARTVNKMKDQLKTKELLSNFPVVAGAAYFTNKVTQNERFVGFLIIPHQSNNLKAEITHIGMQLDTIQANGVKIYLYESSQAQAIKTYTYVNTKQSSLEWKAMSDFIINYQGENYGSGQMYLLGYYEQITDNVQNTQLSGQALSMKFDTGCCNNANQKKLLQRYIGIQPIAIPKTALNWNTTLSDYDLPDMDSITSYQTQEVYGLYPKLNITCDITWVVCRNIDLFARALQHSIAIKVLWDAYNSLKHNPVSDAKRNIERLKQFAMKYEAELNGFVDDNGVKHMGIFDEIVFDISNIDSYCLKCKNTGIISGKLTRPSYGQSENNYPKIN